MARDFDYESVITLEARVKFASKANLYFAVKCEKSDQYHFLLHTRRTINEVSSGEYLIVAIMSPIYHCR